MLKACFGSRRSLVRIQSPRLRFVASRLRSYTTPYTTEARGRSSERLHSACRTAVLIAFGAVAIVLMTGPMPAHATAHAFPTTVFTPHGSAAHSGPSHSPGRRARRDVASWYGPGFYNRNNVACPGYGQLRTTTIGVAHKSMRCGTHLQFRRPRDGRWITAVVIDRGPYVYGRTFDLTAALHARLGLACGVCTVTWRHA